jgi:protein transport protein SEC23
LLSIVDLGAKCWTCRLCLNRSPLPNHYLSATPENLPQELQPSNTTVEYILQKQANAPPIFLFVVDICQESENFQALKDSLLVSLSLLPPDSLVGLISFGTHVNLHELGYDNCFRTVAFNGKKNYTAKQIQETLGFLTTDMRSGRGAGSSTLLTASRYLLPVQEAEFQLTKELEQLLEDSFNVPVQNRSKRATGVALNVAISLLETAFPNTGARIMLFAAGPCTSGSGLVVTPELRETIRSHHDIDSNNAPHYKAACAYYEALGKRASRNGSVVDIFAGCYDQVGLDEMRYLPNSTGGVIVLSDAFSTSIFKQSFLRVFNKDDLGYLAMGFGGNLEVKLSKELKVSGLIGPAIGLKNKSSCVSPTEVGIGGTSSWKLCGISPSSTYALYYDVVSTNFPQIHGNEPTPQAFIQFITYYQHPSGHYRLRVTTVARALSLQTQSEFQKQSFDQEAAAAIVARLAMFKLNTLATDQVIRWIDILLIKLFVHFGDYVRDDPNTFKLSSQLSYFFPQFMFHLRRSQFLRVFNNSPDETAFYRHEITKEDTNNTTIMIQPTLTAYELNKTEPEPVLLDSTSVEPDRILLLDTFFHILIFHGEKIAAWRREGYQDKEEYANFKALLQMPRSDAAELLVDRFPLPRFIDTEANASQARFLMAKLNPSRSSSGPGNYTNTNGGSTVVLTDDVSLQPFMAHLIKVSVSSSNKNL